MLVTEEPVHPPLRLVPPYRSPCRCHPPGAGKPDAIRRGSMAHLPNSSRPALILPFWQPQDRGRLECAPFCAGQEGPHHPRSYARSGEGGAGIQGWPAPGTDRHSRDPAALSGFRVGFAPRFCGCKTPLGGPESASASRPAICRTGLAPTSAPGQIVLIESILRAKAAADGVVSIDVFGAINPQAGKLCHCRQRRDNGTMLLVILCVLCRLGKALDHRFDR